VDSFIPVNAPLLDGNEKKYLSECIDSGWISSDGPFVVRFEREFAEMLGRKHAIAVSSGTAAIDIAVEALGLLPGDEVIMPTFTIISCLHQIIRVGAIPIFVDSDPVTWNMDVGQVESRITKRTRAIMTVHTYGMPVDMDPILELASTHGLRIIEDAAEAIGQKYRGRNCGAFGDISIMSFYPNKHVTTGEGGMVFTDDDAIADRCRSLRNLCFQHTRRFVHTQIGWNYRMTNMQAALGVAQLERLEIFVEKKKWIGRMYNQLLSGLPLIQLPLSANQYAENIYWVYGLILDDSVKYDAKGAISELQRMGIGCRPFFYPMHRQPIFLEQGLFSGEKHPVAEKLGDRGLYLPSGLALTERDLDRVAKSVEMLFV
jgi:perosamine synthetase